MNRDPIQEEGGISLYAFVINDPLNGIDILGLAEKRCGVIVWIGHSTTGFYKKGIRDEINKPKYIDRGECLKHAAYGCNLDDYIDFDSEHIVSDHPQIDWNFGGQAHKYMKTADENWVNLYSDTKIFKQFYKKGMTYEDFTTTVLREVLSRAHKEAVDLVIRLRKDEEFCRECDCKKVIFKVKILRGAELTDREKEIIKGYQKQPAWKIQLDVEEEE